MIKTPVQITGPVRVDGEDPFFCSFMTTYKGDDVLGVLIGDLGRALHKTLRVGDNIVVEGGFKPGGVMYPRNQLVFCIEKMELPEEAKKGRNINMYG